MKEGSPEIIDSSSNKDESYFVRRALSHHLASGPLPVPSREVNNSNKENDELIEERSKEVHFENALRHKFQALILELRFNPTKFESWLRAGQCLTSKVDMISDRIQFANDPYICQLFLLEPNKETFHSTLHSYEEIKAMHESDDSEPIFGDDSISDLEPFILHNWSSFTSLHECARCIRSMIDPIQTKKSIIDDLDELYSNKRFADWQQGWGGVFISALMRVSKRCFAMALYLADKALDNDNDIDVDVLSEMAEISGAAIYSRLHRSTLHGVHMKKMTNGRKAVTAKTALRCFEYARTINDKFEGNLSLWENSFMTGKCIEKIANSWKFEIFLNSSERTYAILMEKALTSYQSAYKEALLYYGEDKVDFVGGGSSHGPIEAFYRLHACRLKILLNAVCYCPDLRKMAEREAIGLCGRFWFGDQKSERSEDKDELWGCLANVIASLVFCRNDNSYFHRSVYRHAQALCWSPRILYDDEWKKQGSLTVLPPHKAASLRGCNSGMPCVESAASVLSVLFDKKRQQMCNVWVTSPVSPSPFEDINAFPRKFNAIRMKYLGAYVDCLRLVRNTVKLETMLSWTKSLKRDLSGRISS